MWKIFNSEEWEPPRTRLDSGPAVDVLMKSWCHEDECQHFSVFEQNWRDRNWANNSNFTQKVAFNFKRKGVRKKEQWFTFKYLHVTIRETPYILYTYIFPGRRCPWLSFNTIRMKVDFRQVEPKGGWSWSGGGTFVLCKKFDFLATGGWSLRGYTLVLSWGIGLTKLSAPKT